MGQRGARTLTAAETTWYRRRARARRKRTSLSKRAGRDSNPRPSDETNVSGVNTSPRFTASPAFRPASNRMQTGDKPVPKSTRKDRTHLRTRLAPRAGGRPASTRRTRAPRLGGSGGGLGPATRGGAGGHGDDGPRGQWPGAALATRRGLPLGHRPSQRFGRSWLAAPSALGSLRTRLGPRRSGSSRGSGFRWRGRRRLCCHRTG